MKPNGRVIIRTPDTRVVIRDRGPVGKQGTKGDKGDTPAWGDLADKPETFPPSAHNHDDRYYTETETDTLLGGKADLVAGKVPSTQLPSYVDDVLEFANLAAFPGTGETGKIYVAIDTNRTYRWSGSAYIETSPSDVRSVAGKTGDVELEIADIDGLPEALENPTPNSVAFDLTPTGAPAVGRMVWNPIDSTLDLPLNASVTLQIGQETLALVVNKTGATIANGKVVKLVGAQGQRMKAELATNADSTAHATIGVATQEIANNATGFVSLHGLVRGLDTGAFTDGDMLWLSTAGNFTATKPDAPAHAVRVGTVVNAANGAAGSIMVHIETGSDLVDLHDVLISDPQIGDTLVWDGAKWINGASTGGGGVDIQDVWAQIPSP